jgi:hypothetical protein
MTFQTFIFYFLSTVLIVAALGVITARNPVHAALLLVLAFFTSSGIWLLLQAEFRRLRWCCLRRRGDGAVLVCGDDAGINLAKLRKAGATCRWAPCGAGAGGEMSMIPISRSAALATRCHRNFRRLQQHLGIGLLFIPERRSV